MSIDQLRLLVRQYISGECAYDAFRRQFVSDCLSVRHADVLVDRLSNAIESLCSDYSNGYIADELIFEAALGRVALPAVARSVQAANQIDFVFDPARAGIVLSDAWWAVANASSVTLSVHPSQSSVTRNDDNRSDNPVAA